MGNSTVRRLHLTQAGYFRTPEAALKTASYAFDVEVFCDYVGSMETYRMSPELFTAFRHIQFGTLRPRECYRLSSWQIALPKCVYDVFFVDAA